MGEAGVVVKAWVTMTEARPRVCLHVGVGPAHKLEPPEQPPAAAPRSRCRDLARDPRLIAFVYETITPSRSRAFFKAALRRTSAHLPTSLITRYSLTRLVPLSHLARQDLVLQMRE